MARRLREAAVMTGDSLPRRECVVVMIHRWENDRSGISERYRLHYCGAFQIHVDQFGISDSAAVPGTRRDPAMPADASSLAQAPGLAPAANPTPLADRLHASYPSGQCPVLGCGQSLGSQILAAARDSGEHARNAERRGVGPAALERFQAVVTWLSRELPAGEPLRLFVQLRRARDEVHEAAREQSWPADQHQVCLVLGCLNSLMAAAAQQAGGLAAAAELAHAGLAYATVIGHQLLIARLRLDLASAAYWSGSFRDCQDQADAGLAHACGGPVAAALHLIRARAAARLGAAGTARQALAAADIARDHAPGQMPAGDLAGTLIRLGCSPAAHHYHTGAALTDIPEAGHQAAAELERAIELYAAASGPGWHEHDEMTARVILAAARLRAGDLDAAEVAAGPVLALPCSRRISALAYSFTTATAALTGPRYHRSPQARHFHDRIERFCAHSIAAHLYVNPASLAPGTAILHPAG